MPATASPFPVRSYHRKSWDLTGQAMQNGHDWWRVRAETRTPASRLARDTRGLIRFV